MRQFIARFFCLLAAITLMELPTIVVQSYAWASMLYDRIPEQGLTTAIDTTFDGAHPCPHCLAAQKMQISKQKKEQKSTTSELSLGNLKITQLDHRKITLPTPPSALRIAIPQESHLPLATIYQDLPVPPPRLG